MERCEPAVGKERADGLCGVRELRGPLGEAGQLFRSQVSSASPPEKGSAAGSGVRVAAGVFPGGGGGVLSPVAEWLTQRQAHLGLMPCSLAAPPLHCSPSPRVSPRNSPLAPQEANTDMSAGLGFSGEAWLLPGSSSVLSAGAGRHRLRSPAAFWLR